MVSLLVQRLLLNIRNLSLILSIVILNRNLRKIAIVATSSKYGGDFDENGKKVIGQVGDGSTLW